MARGARFVNPAHGAIDASTMNDQLHRARAHEREGIDADGTGYSSATTGAGGESAAGDDARRQTTTSSDRVNEGNDVAAVGPGGTPPGVVAPVPGTSWPDPLGEDDDERDLERRTE
jgi:hypothetical protein